MPVIRPRATRGGGGPSCQRVRPEVAGPMTGSARWRRGNGRADSLFAASKSSIAARPLHRPAAQAGPPPPLRYAPRGRMCATVLAAPLRARAMPVPSQQTKSRAGSSPDRAGGVTGRRHDHARIRSTKPRNEPERVWMFRQRSLKAILLDSPPANQESGTPRNAVQQPPCPHGHGTRLAARSPLGVPPRHLRQRPNATAQREPRDFPGQAQSAQPRWFERSRASQHIFTRSRRTGLPCATRGRYPRLAVPAQRDCTRRPVMMPVGRVLPKPPESRGDEPLPAGTALAPPAGVTRPASWYVSEILSFCTPFGDDLSRGGLCVGDR